MMRNSRLFRFGHCRFVLVALAPVGLLLAAGVRPLPAQEPQKKDEQKPAAAQPAPVEGFKWGAFEGHGEIEVGCRWVSDVAGNFGMYRSMVNLGEGVKLLRSNFSLRSNYGTGGLLDHLDFSMNSWGGEPYSTARASFGRSGVYEFRLDYRDMSYYNNIATWANPLLSQGQLSGQHGLDVSYRYTDLEFKLTASKVVRPYFGYARNTGFGPGFSTWRVTGNEFLLRSDWRYTADEYRGGIEFLLPRFAFTMEEGIRVVRNDSGAADAGAPNGNRPGATFLGEVNRLDSMDRGYHDRAKMPFAKALVKLTPFDRLSVSGRYVYSMADLESATSQITQGNIVSLENRLVYAAASETFNAGAGKPSHNVAFTLELTPFSRVRILDQFEKRHLNVSGSTLMSAFFLRARPLVNPSLPAGDVTATQLQSSYLLYDELFNQAEVDVDVGWGLVARGGFRNSVYETRLVDTDSFGPDSRGLDYRDNTAIVGLAYRPKRWLSVAADYENKEPGRQTRRTDLVDYDLLIFSGRAGPWKNMSFDGKVSIARNRNDQPDIDLNSHNRDYSFGFSYDSGERFSLSLDYSRSNIYSNMSIILPATFELDRSVYEERGHGIGASLGFMTYRGSRIDFGYRGILNVGDFPLNYHQPFASLSVPLGKGLAFKSYWQYFGYNEKGASLQDYRTHLVTFGLAFSR